MSVTGYPEVPPARVGMSIGDIGAGLYTAIAVNAALLHRFRTGESTKIDIAMFDCQIALLENAVMRYQVEREIPGPLGARHPTITPFQAFRTADGFLIIAAGNDGLWLKTCEALGRPDMAADPAYKTNALRLKSFERIQDEIESVLKTNTTEHWIAVLGKAGVPCGPINNIEQALAHPQVAARNMLVSVPDGNGGALKLVGNPLKMSAFADASTRPPAPDLDGDRARIVKWLDGA
jgi:CoA:oxalate CoA-transferase